MSQPVNKRTYLGGEGKVAARGGRQSRNRREELGHGSPSMIDDHSETVCSIRSDGTFVYVNDIFCRVFGKKRSQLIGKKWFPIAMKEDLEAIQSQIAQIKPDQPAVVVENRVRTAGGQVRWMQFVNRGLFDEHGVLLETRVVGRDITSRVMAEQALRESNERWKFAIEGSGDGVWDWDVPSSKVSFSERWKSMLGFSADEIKDDFSEWETRVHVDDLSAVKAGLKAHFQGHKDSYVQEFRMRCKDGGWKWILARGRVITRDSKGKPVRIIGTHTDISAAKASKEREVRNLRLVAEGAPLAAVLEAIVSGVESEHSEMLCKMMVVDEGGKYLKVMAAPCLPQWYVNEADTLKIGPESVCSGAAVFHRQRIVTDDVRKDKRWTKRRKSAVKAGLLACWAEPIMSRTGRVLGALACYHRKPHEPTWMEIGTVTNAVALAAVAIEREHGEQLLRESERKFRAVFEQAAVGVAVIETPTGRFLDVNQKMCDIIRLTRDEILKTQFMELTHAEDLNEHSKQMKRLVAGRISSFTFEKRLIRRDGSICWVNLTVSPLWHLGESPDRHVAVIQDITGRREAETNYRRELDYNRALVSNTSIYMSAMDTKGRFIHVNKAFLVGLGYKEKEILNRTPWEIGLIEEKEVMRSQGRFQNLLRGEENPPMEVRLRTRAGEWRAVELRSTSTRNPDGSPDRILMTGTDMTERNRLQQEVLNIVEREQARLGHDLHDGVGQTMTGIVALVEALESELQGPLKGDAARIRKLIQNGVSEIRRMSHGLSPTSVKYRGLDGALQLLAETIELNHRTPCECHVDKSIIVSDPETQAHLFRIAQEAVNNALRHGDPKNISITLRRGEANNRLLIIEDDGSGLPKTKSPGRARMKTEVAPGIGLRVMEYRANLIGAELTVRPRPRRGVVVLCRFPAES
jgi:PAS domain S-box-containing protein